jgi:Relaxase/Mobilisation nuclease domain
MVGKRAKASGGGGGGGAKAMAEYIADEKQKGKKVLEYGGVGFIFDDPKLQKQELIALASSNSRAKNPVNHYILAWKEGEQPTRKQVDEAVQITLDEMGMQGHQAMYCLHGDTDNLHLHLLINRINPETEKSIEINKGFDREALHRSIARIEYAQGWEPENNSRYLVTKDGELTRRDGQAIQQRKPKQRAADFEQRTGEKSAQRIGIEEAAPVILKANNWQQIHQNLAGIGIQYQKKGAGAILIVGETAVKPSDVDRQASLGNLQKRLGAYEPPAANYPIKNREPKPLRSSPVLSSYIETRNDDKATREAIAQGIRERAEVAAKELAETQRKERQKVLGSRWNGRGDFWDGNDELRQTVRSGLAEEQEEARNRLKYQHGLEREMAYTQPLPDFEQWLRDQQCHDLADAWRYRHQDGKEQPSPPVPGQQEKASHLGVYQRHYQDIFDPSQKVDPSRMDGMIAVRMRLTGHTQQEVEQVIYQEASDRHFEEDRNWKDYAKRTAQFAFGAGGDRQVENLKVYREELMELEGVKRKPKEEREVSHSPSISM